MGLRTGLLILLSNILLSAWAAPQAVVDAVQMPAWLDRGGRVLPLTPGLEVKSGDRLRTGAGARATLKLPEGSIVKLGESAQMTYQMEPAPSIFTAALDVVTGAFRFTTAALQKLRKRNVSIQVGTATIGIRGTDVWGKSDKGSDLVMLIEGHVEVTPAVGEAFELKEPMAVFNAPKGGPAAPITLATLDAYKARARETDIWPGDGAARRGGRWSLLLGSVADQRSALELYDQARQAGFAARIRPQRAAAGELHFDVLLPGYASQAEAAAAATRVKASLAIDATPVH